jgi:hypothetical protein
LLAVASQDLLAGTTASANDLAGLWKAKKRFGPDTRGTLVLVRGGRAYTADLAGRVVPVSTANGELTFTLPNGDGAFRGRLGGNGVIAGHWLRPGTAVYTSQNGAPVSASPVVLKPDGPNRWRGIVDPLEDTFTFYLLLQRQPDGSYHAVLRRWPRRRERMPSIAAPAPTWPSAC